MHLLKWAYQPERRESSTWLSIINERRNELRPNMDDSPSLKRVIPQELPRLYRDASRRALDEMRSQVDLPRDCPFTPDRILGDWSPE